MKRVYWVLGLSVLFLCAVAAGRRRPPKSEGLPPLSCSSLKAGDQDMSWSAGGVTRQVRLYVPASANRSKPLPLVIVLHGGGQKGGEMIEEPSRMNETADANSFLVAYPTGAVAGKWGGYTWNGGDCCGAAMESNVDDVSAIGSLIDGLTSGGCVDTKRVYVTGVSNGGIMSYRLACDLSDKIAAAAPIAGSLMDTTCTPNRPVSMYIMHGTADSFINYEGGENWKRSGARRPFLSVKESEDRWLRIDRCPSEPKISFKRGDTTCMTHDGCGEGTAVTVCTIQGGGHAWPGGQQKLKFLIGKTTQDISNQQMWDFFAAHPMGQAAARAPGER